MDVSATSSAVLAQAFDGTSPKAVQTSQSLVPSENKARVGNNELTWIDFFKILYNDQSQPVKPAVKDSSASFNNDAISIALNNDSMSSNMTGGIDTVQRTEVQGGDNNGEPIPAPAVPDANSGGQMLNNGGVGLRASDMLPGADNSGSTGGGLASSALDLSAGSLGSSSSSLSSTNSLSDPNTNSLPSSLSMGGGASSQMGGSSQLQNNGNAGSVGVGSSNPFQQQQQILQQMQSDQNQLPYQQQPQQPAQFQTATDNANAGNTMGGNGAMMNQASTLNGGGEGGGNGAVESMVNNGVPEELLKLPMNRNMPELHVPGGTGPLTAESIKNYYRPLAKAYLSSFSNGIYRQMYFDILRRRTYSLTPPGANKGIQSMLFQILNGKVYLMDPYEVPRNSKPFYRTRINEIIWMLSRLATTGRIKNTEFLMSIHDCVQTVNQPHTYRGAHYQESNPSFTIVNCNFSNNIPFPMWEGSRNRGGGFASWDNQMRQYAIDDIGWERKQSKAVFRGGNRPSMYFKNKSQADEHCDEVGRTRLLHLSKVEPDLLDVSIGGTCGGVHSMLERLEPRDHHRYKYIMYAEGNCMWADRTRQQLFGPSMLIKQETPCGQFFEPLLKPYTHYVPTDFFFTDTVDKVKWARDHDDEARSIVKNANEFAQNFLSLTGIESYVEALLEEYTALLVEPDIKLETGAIDVTNKQV